MFCLWCDLTWKINAWKTRTFRSFFSNLKVFVVGADGTNCEHNHRQQNIWREYHYISLRRSCGCVVVVASVVASLVAAVVASVVASVGVVVGVVGLGKRAKSVRNCVCLDAPHYYYYYYQVHVNSQIYMNRVSDSSWQNCNHTLANTQAIARDERWCIDDEDDDDDARMKANMR